MDNEQEKEQKVCEACGQAMVACATCGCVNCLGLMIPIPDTQEQEPEPTVYYCEVCFEKVSRREED